MRSIAPTTIIKELRRSGAASSMRLANRLENVYKSRDKTTRGLTMNLKTQGREFIKYCIALDPLTEITQLSFTPTDLGLMVSLDHSNVPLETKSNELKATDILIRLRPFLDAYNSILEDCSNGTEDQATKWQHIQLTILINEIDGLPS